ncbi:hypothetical protein [Sphingomonas sp.]|uniref:hypothetical protein n=1 Tax=Sphingomonas sp. TaxID=28214 RepID=UPI0031DC61F0
MTIITVPEQNVDVALPKAFDGVPSPLHPANVDYEAAGGNAAMKQVSDVLAWGWDEANAINDLRPNMDPEHRSATHDRLIRERVDASQRVWADKMDRARATLKAEQARVDRQLEEAAGLKSNPAHFDAITSAFFSMKPGQRAETLAQLVEQGENAALATLMEAPLFLSGLLAEQRDSIKTRVLEKVNPEGLNLSRQLAKAFAKLEDASFASLTMFADLKAGTEPGAAATRARMAAARNMAANAGQR